MHWALCTWAVAYALEELQPDGHHVCARVVARKPVGGHLVGIAKIENGLLEPHHGANVQWLQKLVVQESVRYTAPEIVLIAVVLPELEVKVRTAPVVAAEHLVEHRWLELKTTLLGAAEGIARVYLVVQE